MCRLCRHCIVTFLSYYRRRFYVDYVVIGLLRPCHILDVVSLLIVSSLHSYVPFIFGRRFYVDCVVIPLLRSCQMWTLFLCWLCRHSIVTFLSYLQVVSMCRLCRHYIVTIIWHVYVVSDLFVSSLKCYILVKCGRCFYVDRVVITLLRSCHIYKLFICADYVVITLLRSFDMCTSFLI